MALRSPAWRCAPPHGVALPRMALLSPAWRCAPPHGVALPRMALLSPAWRCSPPHGVALPLACAEVARLAGEVAALKKEMAVKVKHYENKLLTHSVINGALQAENERLKEDLQRALEGAQGGGGGGGGGAGGRSVEEAEQELRELHEEFTRRLNAAEKGVSAMLLRRPMAEKGCAPLSVRPLFTIRETSFSVAFPCPLLPTFLPGCACGAWLCVVCVWCAGGVRVVCVWCACGVRVVCVWCACGVRVVCVWCGVHAFREECFGLRRLVEEQRQAAARMEGEMGDKDAQLQQVGAPPSQHGITHSCLPFHCSSCPGITHNPSASLVSERESEALRQAVGEREAVVARQRQELARVEADRDRLLATKQALEAAAQSADATRSSLLEEANEALAATKQALQHHKDQLLRVVAEGAQERAAAVEAVREEMRQQRAALEAQAADKESHLTAALSALAQRATEAEREAVQREEKLMQEIAALKNRCQLAETAHGDVSTHITAATQPLLRQMEGMAAQVRRMEHEEEQRERVHQEQQQQWEQRWRHAEEGRRRAEERAGQAERGAADAARAREEAEREAQAAVKRLQELQQQQEQLREAAQAAGEREGIAEHARAEAAAALQAAREARDEALRRIREMERAGRGRGAEGDDRVGGGGGEGKGSGGSKVQQQQQEGAEMLRTSAGLASSQVAPPSPPVPGAPPSPPVPGGRGGSAWGGGGGASVVEVGGAKGGEGLGGSAVRLSDLDVGGWGMAAGGVGMERMRAKLRWASCLLSSLPSLSHFAPAPHALSASCLVSQQEGEVRQLQREVQEARAARDATADELLRVSQRLLALEKERVAVPALEAELQQLRARHEVALVMVGERNERVEELEADLTDVRSLYKEQVALLAGQVDPAKWPQGYRICLFCPHCAKTQRSHPK
ncbi:unnamed protein product [Closterium sp. Naga37s-1]|nr:unnamed protein product [Closterium sp. Naga37s-1]